jgi:hypothetical protein
VAAVAVFQPNLCLLLLLFITSNFLPPWHLPLCLTWPSQPSCLGAADTAVFATATVRAIRDLLGSFWKKRWETREGVAALPLKPCVYISDTILFWGFCHTTPVRSNRPPLPLPLISAQIVATPFHIHSILLKNSARSEGRSSPNERRIQHQQGHGNE